MNFRDQQPNPYESPPVLAELTEPKPQKKPQMLPGFPAGACAFFITSMLLLIGCLTTRRGDWNQYVLGASIMCGTFAFLFSLPMLRWAFTGK